MSVISDEFPPKLIHLLRRSEAITVLTGAGISAESGVPTFRAAQTGLWSQYNPAELATPEAFLDNPALVWEWYTWRRELIAAAQPNPGHYSLVEMEKQVSDFSLITQNVDGLHRVAGSQNLIELHGNIQRTKCSADNTIINRWSNVGEVPPRCPDCNNYLRPDVVWFGEDLHAGTLAAAQKKAAGCQVFFSIGTSSIIYPAASLPQIALDNAAVVVEVNPQTTPLTPSATFKLSGPAGEVLPPLIEKTWQS